MSAGHTAQSLRALHAFRPSAETLAQLKEKWLREASFEHTRDWRARHVDDEAQIYALIDPRDGQIRYVGRTTRALRTRLNGHITEARPRAASTPKASWIRQLQAQGLRPLIELLERVPIYAGAAAERDWIIYFAARGSLVNGNAEGRCFTFFADAAVVEYLADSGLDQDPEGLSALICTLLKARRGK